eukprot:scaffold676083_cov36-Prasinocladus_malaysianus.AAC.1
MNTVLCQGRPKGCNGCVVCAGAGEGQHSPADHPQQHARPEEGCARSDPYERGDGRVGQVTLQRQGAGHVAQAQLPEPQTFRALREGGHREV